MTLESDFERFNGAMSYDKDSGNITWRIWVSSSSSIGSIAGHANKKGYIYIGLGNKIYLAHRVAWLLHYGEWPDKNIDHINGNPSDNRILNLRCVSQSVNMQNLRNPPSHNKSGLMGVSWFTAGSKWRATITIGGKEKHLGYFIDKQEAYETYLEAKRRLHEGCTI